MADLNKFLNKSAQPVVLKVSEVTPHEKRPGWLKVSGYLHDGSETFMVCSEAEFKALPEKEGYLDCSTVAKIIKNKIGKLYLKRLQDLPALGNGSDFKSPF